MTGNMDSIRNVRLALDFGIAGVDPRLGLCELLDLWWLGLWGSCGETG